MHSQFRLLKAMSQMQDAITEEGRTLMIEAANLSKQNFSSSDRVKIASVIQSPSQMKSEPTDEAKVLASTVWDLLDKSLQKKLITWCAKAKAMGKDYGYILDSFGYSGSLDKL